MSIEVAKSAGFCFGVDRAVQMVYQLLDEGKKSIYVRSYYSQSANDCGIGSARCRDY